MSDKEEQPFAENARRDFSEAEKDMKPGDSRGDEFGLDANGNPTAGFTAKEIQKKRASLGNSQVLS